MLMHTCNKLLVDEKHYTDVLILKKKPQFIFLAILALNNMKKDFDNTLESILQKR